MRVKSFKTELYEKNRKSSFEFDFYHNSFKLISSTKKAHQTGIEFDKKSASNIIRKNLDKFQQVELIPFKQKHQ